MIGCTVLLVLCAVTIPLVTAEYPEKCAPQWIKKGCRMNKNNDLLPLIDERNTGKIKWDDYSNYAYDLACRCRLKALENNNEWFALQNYGICSSGKGKLEQYLNSTNHVEADQGKCVGILKAQKTIVSAVDGELCAGGEYTAYFHQITNNGVAASAPQDAEEVVAEEEAKQCIYKSDVVLVIDVSGSVGMDNFQRLQGFFMKFIDRYDFQNGDSRLAVIRYDEKCYIDLFWTDSAAMATSKLKEIILKMKYTGGSTLTDNALNCARDLIVKPFKRPGVPITVFVTTDGGSWDGDNRLPPISAELKDPNGLDCSIIVLGVGSEVVDSQMGIMASDNTKIFKLSDFKDLIDHAATHLNKIIGKACVA